MKKCKHLNVSLYEEYITSSYHYFVAGKLSYHDQDPADGEYTGKFWIECRDCKRTFVFTEAKRAPRWAQIYHDLAIREKDRAAGVLGK